MYRIIASLLMLIAWAPFAPAHAKDEARVAPLLTEPLADLPNKEVVMLTVEYGPGQSSQSHRHNAHVFVYVLQGAVMMGVNGKDPVRVEAGQTFRESPSDIHSVSRNASDSAPAKFLVLIVKDKGAPVTVAAP